MVEARQDERDHATILQQVELDERVLVAGETLGLNEPSAEREFAPRPVLRQEWSCKLEIEF